MSGPKHLWSGDWENESADTTAQRVPPPRRAEPEAPPPTPREPRPRRQIRPWVLPVLVGVLVIAAAAFGLSKVFGGSSQHTPGTATAPTASTLPSPVPSPSP